MPVLITGGTGFVGLNVADALLSASTDVVIFGQALPPDSLVAPLRKRPGTLAIETGDVRDGAQLRDILSRHKVDKIIHGAAVTASLDRERTQARTIVDVNVGGTIEVLDAALRHGISRIVSLGTGSVFGTHDPDGPDLDEQRDSPVPENLYGISKYAAERTAIRYRDTRGLDLCVARLGVVFGRYEYDTGVRDTLSVPFQLLHAAEAGKAVRVRRVLPDDWVYATDVADAIVRLLGAAKIQPLYHVSAGRRWSIADWCDRLKGAFPRFSFELVEEDADADIGVPAPRRRPLFSTARLREDTGFAPRFGPAEAFADYVKWHTAKDD
ncbi:MAG: NAD-dependent epimerase/dehydratase family protein [Variibacter sp.]